MQKRKKRKKDGTDAERVWETVKGANGHRETV